MDLGLDLQYVAIYEHKGAIQNDLNYGKAGGGGRCLKNDLVHNAFFS